MTENVSLPERLEATFLTSAPDLKRCPPNGGAEVAFAGRSNAGKSSVLNQLTGNRRTAKVSKTPGRTQLMNFFDVRTGGRMVDLPGYGYAKAGKEAQKNWQSAVNHYLSYRDALVGIVLVMDIRHPNQAFDKQMLTGRAPASCPSAFCLTRPTSWAVARKNKSSTRCETCIRSTRQPPFKLSRPHAAQANPS
jgi:GTP-binding protein